MENFDNLLLMIELNFFLLVNQQAAKQKQYQLRSDLFLSQLFRIRTTL